MVEDKNSVGVQSAEVALQILRVLAEGGGDLALSRLAAAAQMPPAKAHRYVVSLIRAGFVEQAGRHGNYRLGGQALRVGLVALGRLDAVELGAAAVAELRDETDQTVLMAIWGDGGPTVVRWSESSHPVTVNVRTGSIMPILKSATGRVFGAWMPWSQVEPFVRREIATAPRPAAAVAEAKAALDIVRQQGMSAVCGDMLHGVQALGAPVFNAAGDLAAALTVLGTTGSFDITASGRIAQRLRQRAGALSERLGWGYAAER